MKKVFSIPLLFLIAGTNFSQSIDPYKFIATLKFDKSYRDFFIGKTEQLFPITFRFNTSQDGNADGAIDSEDACENIVQYAIGDSIYGTGRTGIVNRGPNDQRPSLYFHFVKKENYDVYEYWLYYADNDYLNNHEHDWEKYFVYAHDSTPAYVFLSSHRDFNLFSWSELPKDDNHIVIGVDGGSHAMKNKNQSGVKIRYNGEIAKNAGKLNFGDGGIFPWRIYSNDSNVTGAINYVQSPNEFLGGDEVYPYIPLISKHDENSKPNPAPWMRREWNNPPDVTEYKKN